MPHLHLIRDNEVAQSFPLDNGEVLLGREDHCDISLGFAGVSRKHLRLLTVMGDTFAEDMGSRSGTYVNGRPARKCALDDGDVLQIGEIELRFEKDSSNEELDSADGPDATSVRSPGRFGPQRQAVRSAGAQIDGISPVAHFTAKAEQLRIEKRASAERKPGLWERIRLSLDL